MILAFDEISTVYFPICYRELEKDSDQVTFAGGESLRQAPPTRPQVEEQSKWKIRINFKRGIKNVAYLTMIMAFLMELTYLLDRLIRKKPLV